MYLCSTYRVTHKGRDFNDDLKSLIYNDLKERIILTDAGNHKFKKHD